MPRTSQWYVPQGANDPGTVARCYIERASRFRTVNDARPPKASDLADFLAALQMRARDWLHRLNEQAPAGSKYRARADSSLGYTQLQSDRQTGIALISQGLALASELGDREEQFLAGGNLISGSLSPKHWREGLELIEPLLKMPRTGGRARTVTQFLQFAGGLQLFGGNRAGWEEAGREMSLLAAQSNDGSAIVSARGHEILRLAMEGQLESAFDVAISAVSYALELGIGTLAAIGPGIQIAAYLGRINELSSLDPVGMSAFGPAVVSLQEANAGGDDGANFFKTYTEIAGRTPGGRATQSMVPLAVQLRGAVAFGDASLAQEFCQIPELREVQFSALTHCYSMRRLLGAASAMLRDTSRARQEYERGLAESQAIRHRPEIALTRLELAELLLEHYPDERDEAIEHLDFSIAELRDMKMQPALERALRHRGLLNA